MQSSPKPEARLVALFLLGILLLGYPLLSIFEGGYVGSVPGQYAYVFAVWAGVIILLARFCDRRS